MFRNGMANTMVPFVYYLHHICYRHKINPFIKMLADNGTVYILFLEFMF
jgi:hypothetical protein